MSSLPTRSIRHRSLSGGVAASHIHVSTREIAADLIALNGSPRVVSRAEKHISEAFGCEVALRNGQLTFVLPSNTSDVVAEIPPPYGLKGGAARELFAAISHQRPARRPRDIDLVRRGSFLNAADEVVAQSLMPHDYRHGARVELIRSMPKYLASRDVTVNELAVFNDTVSVSLLGALDTLGHTLRPSRYRGGSIHRLPSLDGRIFLKMVRLFAEAECYGDPVQLVGIPDQVSFSEFDLALHLDKAFQRSFAVARAFVDTLVLLGALPPSCDPLAALLEELDHLRFGEGGLLPHAPALTRPA